MLLGSVEDIDPDLKQVRLVDGAVLRYDSLIVATGSQTSYFGHDEWQEWAPGLKSIEEATNIRHKILYVFEVAERIPSDSTACVAGNQMTVAKRKSGKEVRRSVTLPSEVARQVDNIAKKRRLSDNRVLVELIEQGIEVRRQKERAFFELAERFRAASDPEQVRHLGDELGRFVFGE